VAAAIGGLVFLDVSSLRSPQRMLVDVALGTAAWLALWLWRWRPTAVAVFAMLAAIVSALAAGPAIVAAFCATVRAPRRGVVVVAAVSVLSAAAFPAIYPTARGYLADAAVGELLTAVVLGWGLFLRARRELVQSLRERAERLQSDQRLKVAQAREGERRRIAREMHDVLAHRVSLLSLHAGALEFRPDAPTQDIAAAAGVIRASAHGVLQDLREVIGVLRADADGADIAAPQRTLAHVPALVAESQATGTPISCSIDVPDEAQLPSVLDRTVYRVVQEGLTNARKHARTAAVHVAVQGRPGDALAACVISCPTRVGGQPAVPGWGMGLVGLRERVTLAGGELEHGRDANGNFVLRAMLPWRQLAALSACCLSTTTRSYVWAYA
jgi:signal transduction histidine kinase